MQAARWIQPDAVLWDGEIRRGVALGISATGVLLEARLPPPEVSVERLSGRLLLPGFVNAHSHAFQRLIRGRTQGRRAGARDDFWTWREAMYRAAGSLGPEQLHSVSRQCFVEMACAGFTALGEFHYLHHQADGRPYPDRLELALQVIRAAREVGLRIALLRVGYARAGFQAPDHAGQRRFYDVDPEAFLADAEDLAARVRGDPLVSVGLAPHSVRAVPRHWLEAVARARGRVVHMHVAEQAAEVEACLAEHGRRPVELLAELGLLRPEFTAVHAIHLAPHEVALLGGASVCACPSTERDLGDGVLPADALRDAGASLCIGTDSQALLDPFEELRALEGHLRLVRGRRVVLAEGPGLDAPADLLLRIGTAGGARALGLPEGVGWLRAGAPADFCTVDLAHPALLGASDEVLRAAVVFGAPAGAVRDVAVQGTFVVRDGLHPLAEISAAAYTEVSRRVFA